MPETDLPELQEIRRTILYHLPAGHHLKSVDLTFGVLTEGQDPAFTVLIKIAEEPDAYSGDYHTMTELIRDKWSRDDLYVKFQFVNAGDDSTLPVS